MFLQRELEEQMLRKNELVSIVKQILLKEYGNAFPVDTEICAEQIVNLVLKHIQG